MMTTTTNTAGAIVDLSPPLLPLLKINKVGQAQANQGQTLMVNIVGQANQECEQQRGLMTTTTTTTTNTAGGIVTVIPPLLPLLEVNNVSQAQANQGCQQLMSTTATMTALAITTPTHSVPLPAIIQPVLTLEPNNGQNDILPSNINVPTSSYLHHELQIRDGRISALESAVEQLRTQLNIFREQMRNQQMSAVNRTRTPTNIELAFQEGCTGSPDDDAGTFEFSLNSTLDTNMNDVIMEESNRRRVNNLPGLDQCNNEARRDPARREEEQEANTPRRRIAREHPGRRDEENHEQHCTKHEQPGVLEHKAIQCSTAQDEPGRREEEPESQYYRNNFLTSQRSNARCIANDGCNAGLVNNTVVCYANTIIQIIASCGCLNESLRNPPSILHKHFSLYYNFASVISSMINGNIEADNPERFLEFFTTRCPQFNADKRKYSVVINVLFLIEFLFTHQVFMLPYVRGCTRIYNGVKGEPDQRAKASSSEFRSYCLRSSLRQRITYVNANILEFIQLRKDNTVNDVLRLQ